MCGIAGCFGHLEPSLLKDMLKILRERGPDDETVFVDAPISLGVTRLAIVDVKHGKQPLSNENGTIWGILNGEIHNFQELRSELEKLGHCFATACDTETLVHAYEEWDVGFIQKLNGMFAFAIWDKNKKMLLVARDRIGIKPLYYIKKGNRFVFASEIKALLADKTFQRVPNDPMIFDFLKSGFQKHNGETFFKGINELLPAHYMLIYQSGITLRKYWDIANSHPKETQTDKDVLVQFKSLLVDSIRIALPKDMAIGTYVSGGLDSSLIACLANSISHSPEFSNCANNQTNKFFSALYREVKADESPFIGEVSQLLGTKFNHVFPSLEIQWDDLKRFVYWMDEPVTVLNYYVYWCLSRITKDQVKVTFSGQGPDEFHAGHPDLLIVYLKELWYGKKIGRLVFEFLTSLSRYGFWRVSKEMLMRLASKRLSSKTLLNANHVKRKQSRTKTISSLNEALFLDVTQNRLPMHLRVGDRVSSAFSIESRFPYLDHRVIEFVFSLPANQKIRNGWTKYLLRCSAKGVVPESVRLRKKMGTPIPLERWMENLHPMIIGVLTSKEFQERPYFSHVAILDLYHQYHEKEFNGFQRNLCAEMLWRILNVELWLESFFDKNYNPQSDPKMGV